MVKPFVLQPLRPGQRPEVQPGRLTVNFAAFHRQRDFGAALVAGDDPDIEAKQFAGHRRQLIEQRPTSGGAEDDLRFKRLIDCGCRGIIKHRDDIGCRDRRTDPGQFPAVVPGAPGLHELRHYDRGQGVAQHRSVPGSGTIDVIGHCHAAAARHVLHDDRRSARHEFLEIPADDAGRGIRDAARSRPDEDRDRPIGVEIGYVLRLGRG